jgi:hypothetical protein
MNRYGLMAEFVDADALLAAAQRAAERGFAPWTEAYSPMPVEGLADALGFTRNRVPLFTLLGGIVGGVGGLLMQWIATALDWPQNIGGRPDASWPLYVPVAFELTILGAAIAAVISMFVANGLPRLHHPVFDAPDFDLATRNRFFLCLRRDDASARALLEELQPLRIVEVPG